MRINFEFNRLKCSLFFSFFFSFLIIQYRVMLKVLVVEALLQKFVRCSSGRFSFSIIKERGLNVNNMPYFKESGG